MTGSASGLGRSIAEAVLASGDSLAATARDPTRLADLVEKYGDRVRTIALDVTDERGCQGEGVSLDGAGCSWVLFEYVSQNESSRPGVCRE